MFLLVFIITILVIGYTIYKKNKKTLQEEIQEQLNNLNDKLQRSEYIVKYEKNDSLGSAFVIYKGNKKMIGAKDELYMMYFIAGLLSYKNNF